MAIPLKRFTLRKISGSSVSSAKPKILITGVPGTGKTTVARLLSEKMDAALLDINKLVNVLKLYSSVDETDGAKVVRLKELQDELASAIKAEKRSIIVEGHLGCEMKLPVSRVIVLRCEPKILRARMVSRNYPPAKVSANALSEALDYCTVWSEKNYGKKKVWELDTTEKSAKQVADEIEKILSGKTKKKGKSISFPDALMREAITGEKIRKIF
ncbi:MAG: AAA family ATPase [Candidatus Micrarchaeota archaeon]|nr:AAA family ATPase [Candidatus Micrarchaeota archaeon]